MAEKLTNIEFVDQYQQIIHKTRINNKHICKWMNACNSINAHQQNKHVEKWDIVKC